MWFRAALLCGVLYFAIGRGSTYLANQHFWRLAAWVGSAVVYGAHIWYEHSKGRRSPWLAALHVAVAVAIGGFGLAVAGMIHSLSSAPTIRPAWLLSLILWPAFTAVPAFLGAAVAEALLRRLRRTADR